MCMQWMASTGGGKNKTQTQRGLNGSQAGERGEEGGARMDFIYMCRWCVCVCVLWNKCVSIVCAHTTYHNMEHIRRHTAHILCPYCALHTLRPFEYPRFTPTHSHTSRPAFRHGARRAKLINVVVLYIVPHRRRCTNFYYVGIGTIPVYAHPTFAQIQCVCVFHLISI